MKLIVGLGNPGKEYENTRHNVGYIFLDNYAKSKNIEINSEKFNGLYVKTSINEEQVILLKPLSYMNLSGEVVKKYVDYFKIDINDILIIHDDLDMDVGRIRLRQKGLSGGHNGIKNIIENLNTEDFKRLKVGISNNKNIETKDYVLGKFSKEEKETINSLFDTMNDIINDYLKMDFDSLMCKYNKKTGD